MKKSIEFWAGIASLIIGAAIMIVSGILRMAELGNPASWKVLFVGLIGVAWIIAGSILVIDNQIDLFPKKSVIINKESEIVPEQIIEVKTEPVIVNSEPKSKTTRKKSTGSKSTSSTKKSRSKKKITNEA